VNAADVRDGERPSKYLDRAFGVDTARARGRSTGRSEAAEATWIDGYRLNEDHQDLIQELPSAT
jgi:hypothetical protein